MRVIKNKKGQFQIDDKAMVLSGKAASQFLNDMHTGESRNPKHEQVLAECRANVDKRKVQ